MGQADMNDKVFFKCYDLFLKTAENLPDELRLKYYDALLKYGLRWETPTDPLIFSLLQWAIYAIDKSDNIRIRQSNGWEKHSGNQYTQWDTKWKAQNNGLEVSGSMVEVSGTQWKKEKEWKRMKENEKENNKEFELFWKEFPHARKWKKGDSLKYFKQQDADSVMKQVYILKRKIRAWLQDPKYIPACERWIRDFTEISEDVINQDLYKIAKRHLNSGWDIKQRATELKQTFGEEKINEIVKAIQQKRITLSLN